jgi:hypothetical protein
MQPTISIQTGEQGKEQSSPSSRAFACHDLYVNVSKMKTFKVLKNRGKLWKTHVKVNEVSAMLNVSYV